MHDELQPYFGEQHIEAEIDMYEDERGVILSLHDSLLFSSGNATLLPENRSKLIEIGKIINTMDNYIRVEGHTDSDPIRTSEFPSNWELSSQRATNVVKLFISESGIPPEKLSSVAYGEYKPVADNDTPENKAKNRRVDIIILSNIYDSLKQSAGKREAETEVEAEVE